MTNHDAQPTGLDDALALEAGNHASNDTPQSADRFEPGQLWRFREGALLRLESSYQMMQEVAAALERQLAAVEAERDRLKADFHTEWIRKHMQALRNGIAAMTQKALGDDEIEAFPYEIIKALGLEPQDGGVDVLAAIQSLRATASQSIEANDTLFEGSTLTVNILRLWDRDRIERFALHLLGDEWQELKAENDRLKEWRDSVSSAIKQIPEFATGKWGGDKDGWGYHFEIVRWITESYGDLTARIAKVEEYGRGYIERTDTQIEGLIKKLEQVEADRNHAIASLVAASACLGDAGFKGSTIAGQIGEAVAAIEQMKAKWAALREDRTEWPEGLKVAIESLESQYGCEMVDVQHHAAWVDRCEGLEADNARLRQQLRAVGEAVKARAVEIADSAAKEESEKITTMPISNATYREGKSDGLTRAATLISRLDVAACGATAEGDNYNE